MPSLKPHRGMVLNTSHPLAAGLVGCWLLNEGVGEAVFDISKNGRNGSYYNSPDWVGGRFGNSLDFVRANNEGILISQPVTETLNWTMSVWVRPSDSASGVSKYPFANGNISNNGYGIRWRDGNWYIALGGAGVSAFSAGDIGQWQHVVLTCRAGTVYPYKNAIEYSPYTNTITTPTTGIMIGGAYSVGAPANFFDGRIDHAMIYNRALTAAQIRYLYRNPFCMFERPSGIGQISAPLVIVSLAGSITGESDASGFLKVAVSPPATKRPWQSDALFNGMTADAFKLGTVLSMGWFWLRTEGCTALYRGPSMEKIDYRNILTVVSCDAEQICPPAWLEHNSDSQYFYVVRRFNSTGFAEHTDTAAVKVSFDADGLLEDPGPNGIFDISAERFESDRIRLTWFYNPLGQTSAPMCFKVYYDNQTGQIDFQNPLTQIDYQGRRYYSYESSALSAGRYLFAVRSEDDADRYGSAVMLKIQITQPVVPQAEIIETGLL